MRTLRPSTRWQNLHSNGQPRPARIGHPTLGNRCQAGNGMLSGSFIHGRAAVRTICSPSRNRDAFDLCQRRRPAQGRGDGAGGFLALADDGDVDGEEFPQGPFRQRRRVRAADHGDEARTRAFRLFAERRGGMDFVGHRRDAEQIGGERLETLADLCGRQALDLGVDGLDLMAGLQQRRRDIAQAKVAVADAVALDVAQHGRVHQRNSGHAAASCAFRFLCGRGIRLRHAVANNNRAARTDGRPAESPEFGLY